MELKELQKNWDEFGKTDPLWAILTDPEKRNGRWDAQEFFRRGEAEVAEILACAGALEIPFNRRRVLDFGCGVGRLSQALCRHFEECIGVDIAPSMIDLAEQYNSHGSRCRYYVNEADNLRLFPDEHFDFICSSIVLQHMQPTYSKKYIEEFLRVLTPGGLLVFQIPSEHNVPRPGSGPEREALYRRFPESGFKAHLVSRKTHLTAKIRAKTTIRVQVKNRSTRTWPSGLHGTGCLIRLGNHWCDATGNLQVCDDGRQDLPRDLEPGEEIELALTVTVPSTPGNYILELDMVQEGVTWFAATGMSEKVAIPVQVKGPRPGIMQLLKFIKGSVAGAAQDSLAPRMEMYGLSQEEVFQVVQTNRGRVLQVQEDTCAGPTWRSFRYYVTR
jgi:SAM-dependent methyltransferase